MKTHLLNFLSGILCGLLMFGLPTAIAMWVGTI